MEYFVEAAAMRLLSEWGQADRLTKAPLGAAGDCETLGRVVRTARPRLILLGSSPARSESPETPEQFAVAVARNLAIPTLGVLDYWGMYKERFTRADGRLDLDLVPDRLCVLDKLCRDDLVALGMPMERLVVTHNPWLDQAVAMARGLPPELDGRKWTLIFASQPLAENASVRGWSMTQNDLFDVLVKCARESGAPWRLEVWPHAAEEPKRWPDAWPTAGQIEIHTRRTGTLGDLARAAALVTSHSTIAHEALHLGVPCISLRLDQRREAAYIAERIQLARMAASPAGLLQCLGEIASGAEHARLAGRRSELSGHGIFFSDGQATQRVLREVEKLLVVRRDK